MFTTGLANYGLEPTSQACQGPRGLYNEGLPKDLEGALTVEVTGPLHLLVSDSSFAIEGAVRAGKVDDYGRPIRAALALEPI